MMWYFAVDGVQGGPVDEAELRRRAQSGALKPADLVWNESMGPQWQPAGSVPGLLDAPPPLPPAAPGFPPYISVMDPVGRAWTRMVEILFRPFELAKWFELGVSAWLAALFQSRGGMSFNWTGNPFRMFAAKEPAVAAAENLEFGPLLDQAQTFIAPYLAVIGWIVGTLVVVWMTLAVVVLWLRCRGRFMFLDNVVQNRRAIAEPWKEFKEHGNSLFRWSLVYALLRVLLWGGLVAGLVATTAMPCFHARAFLPSVIPALLLWGVAALLLALVFAYVTLYRDSFVVPIMYHRDLTATEGWGVFLGLMRGHAGGFLLYGLFYALLRAGAGAAILAFTLATCCIGGYLLMAPYLGAVLVLPISVFFRLYSVEYLRQYGPDYGP